MVTRPLMVNRAVMMTPNCLTDFSRDLFRLSGDRLSCHSPSLILSLFIIIKYRLLRIRLGGKPLFEGAFRDAVKSQQFP